MNCPSKRKDETYLCETPCMADKCPYMQGAREFAEWLCRKSRFEEIDWYGIWDRDEDNNQEFFSIDEVL